MSEQPIALRLADELERAVKHEDADDQVISVARWFVDAAAAELRRLHAEVQALRADAERYRWLREFSANQWVFPIVVSQERVEQGMRYIGPLTHASLDAAIDAARSKT